MASILISQSASAKIDSRLRFRRQEETAGDTTPNVDNTAEATEKPNASDVPSAASNDLTTVILQDGTTLVLVPVTAATAADGTTEAAANAATTGAAGGEDTTAAGGTGAAGGEDTTAAGGTEAPGAATTQAGGEESTGAGATGEPGAATTQAAGEESTGAGATGDAATTEAVTGAATGTNENAGTTEGAATGATVDVEASTDANTDSGTAATSGNGKVTDDNASTDASATGADGVTGATTDADTSAGAVTAVFETTLADNETISTAKEGEGEGNPTQATITQGPAQPDSRTELRVVVNPDTVQGQRGRTVELTCIVYGGDASTSIYWIQEEPERRYALLDAANDNDRQISAGQVSLRARITLDDGNKFGKYTCMAQDAAGNSGSALLQLQEGGGYAPPYPAYPPVRPSGGASGYLRIVAPDMTDGDYVEIQCEGATQEDEGRIEWYFNNQLINDNQPLFPRGKTLHIRPISRAYLGNYRCAIPGSQYVEANSVLTFGGSPQVPFQPVTQGPVTGHCGIDEATCRNGRCIPRAYVNNGRDDCGDGSDEPRGRTDACQPNEIQCANPGNGRRCVQKFWMCDGDRDCDDGSDEQQRYCELLPRQRYCKSSEFQCGSGSGTSSNPVCIPRSFQCDGYNDCPDRSDEIGCVKPTVISPPQRTIQINAGNTLTIQCTARGSPAPYINWRLNWGHICGDGYDNGRCQIAQSIDGSDPTLVTGTLTIRNVNANDGGAYSCEALNNQGFIFAVPDAIVNVIISQQPVPAAACNCNGHSSSCSSDGRCLNCQHNTAGANCEYCASGYQGDARRGTPDACQLIPPVAVSNCNPAGTYIERGGRCICKYNVDGDRCDQCKRSHFYLNPTAPNGCLPCFCSGVSSDCTSSDWRRKAVSLSLNNWNAVPKNFATDRYEARDRIQQRNGGRELSLDQSSLGRAANEVLYWKAPREALGDVVTLYDGNIDVHFLNDGSSNDAGSNDEFLWLRGNNIDLVHKIPQGQRFQANSEATYSVACNERTFTRKDGTYIDRENILMALSDLDTFLVKINPIGGRRNAVLRGVTLHLAARDGNAETALTVESCRCPANYTGTSCEKCAEGYGRPHPLVGIYLGQCWSCRALCNERSDQCDRENGKCSNCQGNSEGDRCERCRAGYTLDGRSNQCVQEGSQYGPQQPQEPTSRGVYYIDQRPYDSRGQGPLSIVLDNSQPEQRIPIQIPGTQPRSVVWGRTDGSALPRGVVQEGNDLVIRNPSAEQGGHYIATITHLDGTVERIPIHLDYRPSQVQPAGPGYGYLVFSPPSPLNIQEGANQYIQPPSGYYSAQWSRADGQPFGAGVSQNGNALQINGARPEHSGAYNCVLYGADGAPASYRYEIAVQGGGDHRGPGEHGGAPKISIKPRNITLKEGQRMIVQYTVASHDPIQVTWNRWTDQGYQPIPSLFTVEKDRLILTRATFDAAGTYQVIVRNAHGEDRQELTINVEPRRGRGRGQQAAGAPQIRMERTQYDVGENDNIDIVPNIYGTSGASITWSKDGSTYLPDGVVALNDGTLRINGRSQNIAGQYILQVVNAYGRTTSPIQIQWRGASDQQDDHGAEQDQGRSYVVVRLESRDEQNHQVGRDVHLQCSVHGNVERPYEYTYTKDGRSLENNVEVHPDGLLIIRNAQANDAGRYRCEVTFPRARQAGTQEASYDLRIEGASAGGQGQGYQYGTDYQAQQVEVTVHPSEATISRGEKANITCHVKGAQQYTVKWGKYAHDTSLPDYARQQGNSVIITPGNDAQSEQMYLQCQVDVTGQAQPIHAYAPVNIRGGDESSKKKKKRRS